MPIGQMEARNGVPQFYFLTGDTIELLDVPNYNSTGGLKVFFTRDTVDFVYNDTTKVPGFASAFHTLVSLGSAIAWLEINQPNSGSLPIFEKKFIDQMDDLEEFYSERWKDNNPMNITARRENME